MKVKYLSPESKVKDLNYDSNFLITGSKGEDLEDPEYVDPWSS